MNIYIYKLSEKFSWLFEYLLFLFLASKLHCNVFNEYVRCRQDEISRQFRYLTDWSSGKTIQTFSIKALQPETHLGDMLPKHKMEMWISLLVFLCLSEFSQAIYVCISLSMYIISVFWTSQTFFGWVVLVCDFKGENTMSNTYASFNDRKQCIQNMTKNHVSMVSSIFYYFLCPWCVFWLWSMLHLEWWANCLPNFSRFISLRLLFGKQLFQTLSFNFHAVFWIVSDAGNQMLSIWLDDA